jgi:polysaccharide export outer membrane protein
MKDLCRAVPFALSAFLIASPATAQEAQSAPTQFQPTSSISTYRITPGDEIEVYVWGEERLQRSMRVLPDGTIAFPLVGQVAVAGRLPQEVEAVIRTALSGQYRGEVPQVTVSVLTPAPMRFTVLEALSQAGGGTEFANLDRITILRKTPTGLRALEANIKPLLRGRVNAADLERANIVQIEAGDTIIVP